MEEQTPKDAVVNLRGNIQTCLEKLHSNNWDGAIFAAAALERLEISQEVIEPLRDVLPAPAQGALVVCHLADEDIAQQLTLLNDRESEVCTQIERDFLRTLEDVAPRPLGLGKSGRKYRPFFGWFVFLERKRSKNNRSHIPYW